MHLFGYKVGVYSLIGSELTMDEKSATLTTRDNCHRQWNYKKTVPLNKVTYRPQLGRTKYGLVLVLHKANGEDDLYEKETGKSLLTQ
jgi:hypothetical protein